MYKKIKNLYQTKIVEIGEEYDIVRGHVFHITTSNFIHLPILFFIFIFIYLLIFYF